MRQMQQDALASGSPAATCGRLCEPRPHPGLTATIVLTAALGIGSTPTAPVVVINERTARQFWPAESPLGH